MLKNDKLVNIPIGFCSRLYILRNTKLWNGNITLTAGEKPQDLEVVTDRCPIKKVFLKILQSPLEKMETLFNKVVDIRLATF